jgi:hypothetical protein
MLLGLALAPLAEERQDDDDDAKVGLHVPLQPNVPMSQKPIATLPPSMLKPDNGSVDAAAKKVFSVHPLCALRLTLLSRQPKPPPETKVKRKRWPKRRLKRHAAKPMLPGETRCIASSGAWKNPVEKCWEN